MRTECALLLVVTAAAGQRLQDQPGILDSVEDLCKDRPPNEYFRLTTEGDCRDVVRCDRAGIAGTIRLASVKCPSGLAFDLDRQTCDWKAKVTLQSLLFVKT